jgi:uncharacterized protein YegL
MNALEDSVEFAENPEPRVPCVLLLDTSFSMEGAPIASLNAGLATFRSNLLEDPVATKRVEVAIVTFNSTAEVLQDFVTVDNFEAPVISHLGGATCMCAGVEKGLSLLQERKALYRQNGIAYYQPWLFVITDGQPTESAGTIRATSARVKDEETKKKLAFFAIGVEGANMELLRSFSLRPPAKMTGLNFTSLFVWLSASMQRLSASKAGERTNLPPVDWGTVG